MKTLQEIFKKQDEVYGLVNDIIVYNFESIKKILKVKNNNVLKIEVLLNEKEITVVIRILTEYLCHRQIIVFDNHLNYEIKPINVCSKDFFNLDTLNKISELILNNELKK